MEIPGPQLQEEKIKFSKGKLVFYFFALLLFVLIVYYFARIRNNFSLLIKVQPAWLAIAVGAQAGTYLLNSFIGHILLRSFDPKTRIPVKDLFKANIVTLFINQTIPSVQLSGNIYFFNFLKRRGVAEQKAYSLLLLELLTFYTAVICIILVLLAISIFQKAAPAYFTVIFVSGIFAFAIFAFLIGLLGRGKNVASLLKKLARIRFLKKGVSKFETIPFAKLKNPWRIYKEHTSLVIRTIFLHSSIFLFDSITVFALFHGLGVSITYLAVFTGFILTKIISLLPFIPGALILYEGSMTFFYVHLGVPVAVAAMVTLLYRVLSFWLPIPAGFFLYRKLQQDDKKRQLS